MELQAERLRANFSDVGVAFLAHRPYPDEVLPSLQGARVFVVPMFMAEGHFTRVALPAAVGLGASAARPVTICAALGAGEGLAEVILGRAVAACREHGLAPNRTSVVLAAHGSRDNPASRCAATAQSERLAGSGRFAAVRVAFLEEAPSLPTALEALDGDVLVVGLFALPGGHAEHDIPAIIAAERGRRRGRTVYTGAVGADPAIANAVLDLVENAAAR